MARLNSKGQTVTRQTQPAQWQLNQSGTHYADYCGHRIAVRREAPRARTFKAAIDGTSLGIFEDMAKAQQAAEQAARKNPR